MERRIVAGLNLYRANYECASGSVGATRLIAAPDVKSALDELASYGFTKAEIELIEDDISMVILEKSE